MKSILLALALITSGAYAADDADFNPCDAVENDQQTLACSVYSRNAAEQLLTENYEALQARMTSLYGSNATQLNNITSKIKPPSRCGCTSGMPIARWWSSRPQRGQRRSTLRKTTALLP